MGIGDQIRRLSWAVSVALASLSSAAIAQCQDDKVTLWSPSGTVTFDIELAVTPEQTSRGLMFRDSLDENAGMLFFFTPPRRVAFWMRNTLIPLDMVFADGQGVVQRVHVNAIPGDETSIPGGADIQFVLEINGGMADVLGLGPGTQMQHPAIEDAAWPCEASSN